MKSGKSYEDLVVWQKSIDFTLDIYALTSRFPKEELYGLTSQMRQCASSVPSNLAEGCARNSRKEFAQFISIAAGSLAELDTWLLISLKLGYLAEEEYNKLRAPTQRNPTHDQRPESQHAYFSNYLQLATGNRQLT